MKYQGTNGNGNGHNGHSNGRTMVPLATPRDLLTFVFRQRRVVILSFTAIFLGAALYFLFLADRYEAKMMILVDRDERTNPVVTAQSNETPAARSEVSEEEMNSEYALLQSQDLLEQVVERCGLDSKPPSWLSRLLGPSDPSKDEKLARAARALANKLDIEIVKRSNVISIAYRSSDPKLAAQVLQTVGDLYLKKHAAVHRPRGAVDFFQQETDQYRNSLSQAETRLVRFADERGVVSAPLETDAALRRLDEFQSMAADTRASIAQTEERIRSLEAQQSKLGSRLTTQVKISDNAPLLEQLKATLLNLELKRTELLEKFEPTYRPVKEVETQIAQTQAALADAERSQWREETTDRDPAFELVREDLAKSRAELAGLRARGAALGKTVRDYESKAQWLHQQGIQQEDLVRNAKAEEENYLLYLRKREEARISDALDTRNILDVTVAEAAAVPSLPVHSNAWYLLLSAFVALLGSLGLAFVSDSVDPTLRTPDEVESFLNLPVLVSLPKKENGRAKGNGNGRIGLHVY